MKKVALIALMALLVMSFAPAYAHEGREVGEYSIVFGWRLEPAVAGVLNGPELMITHHDTEEPVEGLEATLQIEIQFGPATKVLELYPVWNSPGHYTADLIPTRPGDYTFIVTGTIEDTEINEKFTSADGEFSTVEPATDLLFPDSVDTLTELQALRAELDALKAEIEALKGE